MKFSELNLEEGVLQALDAMRFEECTPVQEHTIPVILEGKDLIGAAHRDFKTVYGTMTSHRHLF